MSVYLLVVVLVQERTATDSPNPIQLVVTYTALEPTLLAVSYKSRSGVFRRTE